MRRHHMLRTFGRVVRPAGLLLALAALPLLLPSAANAQDPDTVIRIEIVGTQPVPSGEQFEARVVVDDVEHLAGFDFTIAYDPERVRPVGRDAGDGAPAPDGSINVEALDLGDFIKSNGERGEDVICTDPTAATGESAVTVTCNSLGPPLCFGGQPGASGSGVLGSILFESRGGEVTTLELTESNLVLDDVEPCDPETFRTVAIEHLREDATVTLIGGGSDTPWAAIIAGVAAVVVVVGGGGVAGLAWYRRRSGAA